MTSSRLTRAIVVWYAALLIKSIAGPGQLVGQRYTRSEELPALSTTREELASLAADIVRSMYEAYDADNIQYGRVETFYTVDLGNIVITETTIDSLFAYPGLPSTFRDFDMEAADSRESRDGQRGRVRAVDLRLGGFSNSLRVTGSDRLAVDAITHRVLDFSNRERRLVGRTAGIAFEFGLFVMGVLLWAASFGVDDRRTDALLTVVGLLFMTTWIWFSSDRFFPQFVAYSTDASWLERSAPLWSFLGVAAAVAVPIISFVRRPKEPPTDSAPQVERAAEAPEQG